MSYYGEKVKKLVWIVRKNDYESLKRIVDSWICFFSKFYSKNFPMMEYRDQDGNVIKEVNVV